MVHHFGAGNGFAKLMGPIQPLVVEFLCIVALEHAFELFGNPVQQTTGHLEERGGFMPGSEAISLSLRKSYL